MSVCLPVDDATRRDFVVGSLGLAALLAGCGAAPATSADAPGAYPRTVTDATGTDVVLDARPRRIACAQNVWDLDAVLALGEVPVQFGLRDFAEYTGSTTTSWPWHERALDGERPERVAVGEELSVEAIAAAPPDLIVGDSAVADVRDRLGSLAPVVQIASFDWRRNLRILGEALDLSDDAEALVAQTDQRLATSLDGYDLAGARVAVLGVYDATAFYLFGNDAIPVVDLLRQAGFGFLDELTADATPDAPRVEYSAEQFGLLDPADLVVVFDYGDSGVPSPVAADPLFARLPAVQAGRVVVVEQGERAQGLSVFGPLNLQLGLDFVRECAELVT